MREPETARLEAVKEDLDSDKHLEQQAQLEDTKKLRTQGWIRLADGKGIKWALTKTHLLIQRKEKQGDRWLITEEIHLTPKVLRELYWRIPRFLYFLEPTAEWDSIDDIVTTVLEHSQVVGVSDYSGNAEVEIFDQAELKKKISELMR